MASETVIPEIMEKLLTCEHPFRWQIRSQLETIPDDMVRRLTDQLDEKIYEDEFHFENLMLYVGLAYEHGFEKRIEEALKTLETGEKKFEEFRESLSSINMCDAVKHIILSTKMYLLVQKGDLETNNSIIAEIPLVDEMSNENQAALYGLRAVFSSEYGIDGTKAALGYSCKALEMNTDEPLWYFLKGKYLGRIRRVERPFDIPEREEIELLEKSMTHERKAATSNKNVSSIVSSELEENESKVPRRNASFMVFTAEMYRETARSIFRLNQMNPSKCVNSENIYAPGDIPGLNKKSLEYYDESIRLKPECPRMMFRCAKGYIMLPPVFREKRLEQAKTLLKKGLEIVPDSGFGNHVMSKYYEKVQKPAEAIKHLKICEKKRIFGAVMDLIRLEYQLDKTIDFVQRMSDLLEIYHEKSRKYQMLSQLISYHILVSNNLEEACSYAFKVILSNPNCEDMTKHQPVCKFVTKRINLYDLLIDEIKIAMQDSELSHEKKEYYNDFFRALIHSGKEIPPTGPLYLKNSIMNTRFNKMPYKQGSQNYSNRPNFRHNARENANTFNRADPQKYAYEPNYRNNGCERRNTFDKTNSQNYRHNGQENANTFDKTNSQNYGPNYSHKGQKNANTFNRNNLQNYSKGPNAYDNAKTFNSQKNSRNSNQQEEFKNWRRNDNASTENRAAPSQSWHSRQQPESQGRKTAEIPRANEGPQTPKGSLATRGSDGEDSDDTSFRMMIYEKSKLPKVDLKIQDDASKKKEIRKSKKEDFEIRREDDLKNPKPFKSKCTKEQQSVSQHSHEKKKSCDVDSGKTKSEDRVEKPDDIATSFKTMKIQDDASKKNEVRESKKQDFEIRREDNLKNLKPGKSKCTEQQYVSQHSHEKKESCDVDSDIKTKSEDHTEHKSKNFVQKDCSTDEVHTSGRRQKSEPSPDERKNNEEDLERQSNDSRRRDERSHHHKSKNSYKKRNSNSVDVDEEPESVGSRQRYYKSYEQEFEHSLRRRNSSESEDSDKGADYRSVDNRRTGVNRKHKRFHRTRNSSNSEDGKGDHSYDRESKRSSKRKNYDDDDSRRRDRRSHHHKSERSHKRRDSSNSDDQNSIRSGHRRSYDRDSRRSHRRKNSRYGDGDGSVDSRHRKSKRSPSKRSDYQSDDRESKRSHRKKHSRNSKYGDDDKSVDSRCRDRRSHDHRSERSHKRRDSSNSDDRNSIRSGHRRSYDRKSERSYRRKHSRNSKYGDGDESVDSRHRKSKRSPSKRSDYQSDDRESKCSHRKKNSKNLKYDDHDDRSECKRRKSRSRRKVHNSSPSNSENECERERRSSSRKKDHHKSSRSRRKYENEEFSSSRHKSSDSDEDRHSSSKKAP